MAEVKKSKTIEKPELKEAEKPSKKPSKQVASKTNQDPKTPVVMVEPLKPSKPLKPSPKPETAKIEPEKPEKSEKQTIKPDMVVTKTPTTEKMDIKNKVAEVVEKVAKKETIKEATKATPTEIIVDKEKKAVSDKKSIVVEPLVVEEKITGTLIS